ncbi:MAG: outer membrane beta-barrel protein [Oleispira sp.]|nr:outer membrane beta-barrel protein [Oleispira sp.]MBL4882603.1 outer membrane beta-barrel protein [Oleispira sp.]
MKIKPASLLAPLSWLTVISAASVLSPVYAAEENIAYDDSDEIIEEVVATGTYTADSVTTQERDSSSVLDSIGAEEFSRYGDSDAASALKRVAGVSIAGGKYVVIRGLNERHSSIMLNGASLPSPDPSRRVVPLDIFPSTLLSGIDVQKNFTPDVFADSTGGTIKLSTKKFPQEFEGKISGSLGYITNLTGEQRELQQSEGTDFLGFGASGDRALPSDSFNPNEYASNFGTEESTILPNSTIELSLGDTLIDNDDYSFGYTGSVRYSNEWSRQDRESNTYLIEGGKLVEDDDYDETRTSNSINLGAGISFGLIAGDNEFGSNTMLLRQTLVENNVREGTGGDQDQESIDTRLGWYERQFLFQQFTGEHYVADFLDTDIKWQVSISEATLDAPDERYYSYQRDPEEDELYELKWSTVDRVYNELTDTNADFSLDFTSLIFSGDTVEARLEYGLGMFSRERTSQGTRIGYDGKGTDASDYAGNFDIDYIIDDSTASGETTIIDQTAASDSYDATWDLTSAYLATNIDIAEFFSFMVGARSEQSNMEVNTFDLSNAADPVQSVVEDDDIFPTISGTYRITEEVQLRAAYYQTKNRPDFRELANAQYLDPDSGDIYRGNPDLVSAEIDNIDVRAEWYFSDSESISLAYFNKDFTNPIEKTLKTGGDVFTFDNASKGKLSGYELDVRTEMDFESYSTFIAGNFAIIDSEVDLVVDTELKTQSMQGQADQLANIQLGFDHLMSGTEVTLIVNYQGESLDAVAPGILPDIMREPRTEVHINVQTEISEDVTINGKLKNITDEKIQLTQGGKNYRSYSEGVEISFGLSMNF